MIRIHGLSHYPIKGCRAIALERGVLSVRGIELDREWMLIDAKGIFVTQRADPALATVSVRLDGALLHVEASSHGSLGIPLARRGPVREVRVWRDDCQGEDMGDEPAEWFSRVLGREVRLLRFAAQTRRDTDATYAGTADAPVAFADGYPVLVVNLASLEALNSQLAVPLPVNRFRPNVVIEGLGAWDEDRIDTVASGEVELKLVKPCTRCAVTTTDQSTGERHGEEPLRTLKRLRWNRELMGVTFGENAVVTRPGALRVGDGVEVRWRA